MKKVKKHQEKQTVKKREAAEEVSRLAEGGEISEIDGSLVLHGEITIPYTWTTGFAIGRFLGEIKEHARLLGGKCPNCKKIFVPIFDCCPMCLREFSEKDLVPVKGEGEVIALTRIYEKPVWSPFEPPYSLILVKLKGTDSQIIHVAFDKEITIGSKVKVKFKEKREGSILDFEFVRA